MKSAIYRIIAMVLVISLTISSMIVPASAADIEPAMKVHDLMKGTTFHTYLNNVQTSSDSTLQPVVSGSGTAYSFSFDMNTNITFSYILFTVDLSDPNAVSSCRFIIDSTGSAGRVVAVNGMRVTFRADATTPGSSIRININYPSKFVRVASLISCLGFYDTSTEISSVDIETRSYFMNYDGTFYSNQQYRDVSLPKSSVESGGSETVPILTHSECFAFVTPEQRNLDYANSISFLVTVVGDECEPSAALVDEYYTLLSPLPSLSCQSVNRSTRVVGDFTWYLSTFLITVDLTGFDLTDKTIQLFFTCDAADSGSMDDDEVSTYLCVEGCFITSAVEAVDSWYGKIFWYLASIRQTIRIEVREVVTALTGGSETQEKLENAGAAMNDQAQEFNDAQASLDAVGRPELDTNQMFGSFLNFDNHSLVLLSSITSNPYVTGVMLVVFTFALCGYVFFGKKK